MNPLLLHAAQPFFIVLQSARCWPKAGMQSHSLWSASPVPRQTVQGVVPMQTNLPNTCSSCRVLERHQVYILATPRQHDLQEFIPAVQLVRQEDSAHR
jgi:hypothetical protein